MTRRVQKQLFYLHYDRLWIKSGLMDEAWLNTQVEARKTSGESDASTAAYHFDSFQHVLDTRPTLTDAQIADYVTLARKTEACIPAVKMLIGWRGLRPHQLHLIREVLLTPSRYPFYAFYVWGPLEKAYQQRAFLFSLASDPLTDEAFDRYMAGGDPDVQESLLRRKDLQIAQLQAFAERGASRAIREAAAARLQHVIETGPASLDAGPDGEVRSAGR